MRRRFPVVSLRLPPATRCNAYRDTKLLAAIPIGIEEEVLPREMDTQNIVSTPNF